jgi:hypothetical protein
MKPFASIPVEAIVIAGDIACAQHMPAEKQPAGA